MDIIHYSNNIYEMLRNKQGLVLEPLPPEKCTPHFWLAPSKIGNLLGPLLSQPSLKFEF